MPAQHRPAGIAYLKSKPVEWSTLSIDRFRENGLRRDFHHLIIIYGSIIVPKSHLNFLFGCSENLEGDSAVLDCGDVEQQVFGGVLYYAQLTIRHEVLNEFLFLVWLQP